LAAIGLFTLIALTSEEFRRLYRGLFTALVILAIGGFLFKLHGLRPWVFLALPAIAAKPAAARVATTMAFLKIANSLIPFVCGSRSSSGWFT
ncbi:hypothetical protein ACFQ1S_02825, partial [Kibdelosporangium lantanae]